MKRLFACLAALSLLVGLFAGCGQSTGEVLYLYNWTEYIPQEVYDQFEAETGIRVIEATFSSNEEMLAKLQAGGTGQYDLVVASNYVVSAMKAEGMIQPIDKSKMENLGNIDPAYMDLEYDPGNEYTIPYMGTLTVIAANKPMLEELGVTIESLNDLTNPALQNNLVIPDDCREVVDTALKVKGEDPDSQDQAVIEGTIDWLSQLKGNVRAYDSDNAKDKLIYNDVAAGLVYNLDAAVAVMENPDVEVLFVDEPYEMAIDSFVITSDAKNKENAEKFIDFIHRGDVYKIAAEEYPALCFNNAAFDLMDDEYKKNPAFNVPKEEITRAHITGDVGDAAGWYDEVFTRMKTN